MKGFLKGLKYIQQIFEDEEDEEPEMQIGAPTDVKHVAHIGHDGPSANAPSWMTEYNPAPELSAASLPTQYSGEAKTSNGAGGNQDMHPSHEKPKHRSRRKSSTGTGSPLGSPRIEKHTRRRSSNISMESPGRDTSNHGRRHRSANLGSDSPMRDVSAPSPSRQPRRSRHSNLGGESPMHEGAAPPRQSRPKKSSKGTSGEGSTRSSKSNSKGQTSLSDVHEVGSEVGNESQRSSFSDTHLEIKGDERYRG